MPVDKDTLREFYTHVFPTDLICQWLSYGSAKNLHHREVSYAAGEYVRRFMTFPTADALRAELVRVIPEKVDFGAIFNVPCEKKALTTLTPLQRELVFDIDATDYDNVRFCCSEKDICASCWAFMAAAVRTLSDIIRTELGFSQFFWVYSGRRGIHCWVCDEGARNLTDAERAAIVNYINVSEGALRAAQIRTNCDNELKRKKWLHPMLRRVVQTHLHTALSRSYLEETNANCIWTNEKTKTAVRDYFHHILPELKAKKLLEAFSIRGATVAAIHKAAESLDVGWAFNGFLLAFFYPRLDLNVSKARNHLLKSPFAIHPSTGRLCVALDEKDVESFDPCNDPPVVREIIERVHKGDPIDLSKWYRPVRKLIAERR
ncbi:DNA primase small subunit [Perkinsela sp. CCAP 1560/4]|nr:DNA primase small subunit [Perkinsela sp. CCAP 1560/4]|eukprot:KNH05320.1 DNA primase small subunit [Perkinsela sp. CCAP 1560/4]